MSATKSTPVIGAHINKCSICHDSILPDNQINWCGFHYFHKKCMGEWINHGNTTCPICRYDHLQSQLLDDKELKRNPPDPKDLEFPSNLFD